MSADFLNKDLGMPLWASTLMLPAGDFAAGPLGLDILASTFVFLAVILVPAVGYKWLRLNEVLAFWFAYTITRPLGASFADWLSVPAPYGDGLQLGTGPMSLVFGIVLAGVIAVIVVRHRSGTAQNPPVLTAASPRWLT